LPKFADGFKKVVTLRASRKLLEKNPPRVRRQRAIRAQFYQLRGPAKLQRRRMYTTVPNVRRRSVDGRHQTGGASVWNFEAYEAREFRHKSLRRLSRSAYPDRINAASAGIAITTDEVIRAERWKRQTRGESNQLRGMSQRASGVDALTSIDYDR
jgi:hypothetical protein